MAGWSSGADMGEAGGLDVQDAVLVPAAHQRGASLMAQPADAGRLAGAHADIGSQVDCPEEDVARLFRCGHISCSPGADFLDWSGWVVSGISAAVLAAMGRTGQGMRA